MVILIAFGIKAGVYSRLKVDDKVFINSFDDISEIITGYLSDELFYKQAVEKLSNYNTPFFTFLVSASSHTPFELDGIEDKYSKVTVDVGEYKGISFGNYLEAVNYADYAFGTFLQELKDKGLYDDSVIIVFGDHYGMGMYDWDMTEFIDEDNLRLC